MTEESKAMEFLMTYGWAILVAIIAIGILTYFGVFDFDKQERLRFIKKNARI